MMADNPYLPIIGVVGDVNEGSVRTTPKATVFYSHGRMTWSTMTPFRARVPAGVARRAHHRGIARARSNARGLERSHHRERAGREPDARTHQLISTSFGVGGLLLATLGLYGLLAYLVAERTKDIGIRIALGARLGRITGSVVAGGLALVAIGSVIGLAASLLLLQSFDTLFFGVRPNDVPTYVTVVVLLGAIAALASYLPARRAARVGPLTALRQE
jgi:putative ABC transport system permease protein